MCNSPNCSHDNLDDDLGDIFGGPVNDTADAFAFATSALSHVTHDRAPAKKAPQTFEEKCPSCNGSGRFYSYSGRLVGSCFKCKGSGKLVFRTSPETRAKAADARMAKADRERIELQARKAQWAVDNLDAYTWMCNKAGSFEFAQSMLESFHKYGSLTEKQLAAVLRCVARDIERAEARKVEAAERVANAPVCDVSAIATAFAHAKAKGIKRPKLRLAGYKFSEAPATGRNAGALYVVRVSDDQYMGKVQDGKFSRVRECSVTEEAEIVAVSSDPHNAAIAYGRRTGNCCVCGRELTNHDSIEAGIGPICAEKFGWV